MHSSAQNCVVIRHSGQVLTRLCTAWQLIKPDDCTPVHAAVSDAIMQRDGPLALLQRALPPDQMCMADWYLLRRVRLPVQGWTFQRLLLLMQGLLPHLHLLLEWMLAFEQEVCQGGGCMLGLQLKQQPACYIPLLLKLMLQGAS